MEFECWKEKYAIEAKQTKPKFLVKNSSYIVNIVQHKWAKSLRQLAFSSYTVNVLDYHCKEA